jgi:hypothetical protein
MVESNLFLPILVGPMQNPVSYKNWNIADEIEGFGFWTSRSFNERESHGDVGLNDFVIDSTSK